MSYWCYGHRWCCFLFITLLWEKSYHRFAIMIYFVYSYEIYCSASWLSFPTKNVASIYRRKNGVANGDSVLWSPRLPWSVSVTCWILIWMWKLPSPMPMTWCGQCLQHLSNSTFLAKVEEDKKKYVVSACDYSDDLVLGVLIFCILFSSSL